MITVIIGTNRPDSNSQIVADAYCHILSELEVDNKQLKLIDLPREFSFADMYGQRTETMQTIINTLIDPVEKFVFVIPEYNGGFPGVLKSFLDCVPPSSWHGKKAGLVGISSGAAGSLRGMDQFTNVLNYLKVSVLYAKPKLSGIEAILGSERKLEDGDVMAMLKEHATLINEF
jgi:chromate reductase